MRILCASDLHLGRRSSRFRNADPAHTSTAEAWQRFVHAAVAAQVDAVALGGDVVDQENRFYEALGPLERGLRRLADAGIPVVAVAGNHDWDVLPDLARTLRGALRLVGVGGQWERAEIDTRSGPLVVHGWSFPQQHVRTDPMHDYPFPAESGHVLGLLHTDLGQHASSYAATTLAQLQAQRVSCWLVGHVHAPCVYEAPGCASVLNPGSPHPLDPGEPDAHHAWLVELRAGQPARFSEVSVAAARYGTVTVSLDDVTIVGDARDRITAALQNELLTITQRAPDVRIVSVRVHLTGRTALHEQLVSDALRIERELTLSHGHTSLEVERVHLALRPARDLAALSHARDAAGFLARLVMQVDRPPDSSHGMGPEAPDARDAHHALRERAAAIRTTLRTRPQYATAAARIAALDDHELDRLIAQQADRLLDALLQQCSGDA